MVASAVAAVLAGAYTPAPHTAGLTFKAGELAVSCGTPALAVGLIIGAVAWAVVYFGGSRRPGLAGACVMFGLLFATATAAAAAGVFLIAVPNLRTQDVETTDNFAASYHQTLAIDSHAYAGALGMLGPSPLTTEALAGDTSLVKAREYIAQARAIIQKYETLQVARHDAACKRIGGLALSPEQRRLLVEAFDRATTANKPLFDAYWSLETRSVDILSDLVEMLARTRGAWTVSHDMIVFTSRPALQQLEAGRQAEGRLKLEAEDNLYKLNIAPVFRFPPAQPGQHGTLGGRTGW